MEEGPAHRLIVVLHPLGCQSCGTIGGSLGLVDQETDTLAGLAPMSGINTIIMMKRTDPQGIFRTRHIEQIFMY